MHPIEFPNALNPALFLKHYWQKKPLFMPNAWPDFRNPLSAEELAGLALDEQMPARIVEQHSAQKWTVRSGPFSEEDFAKLEGKRWSLLITDMEKHLPDLMAYVQPFRFIPDWRFDDLMISYAPPGGSVGPHIDDYDTFLIQTEGQRNWQLEGIFRSLPQADEDLIEDTALRLIKQFNTDQEYLCSPGDILYLPPKIGHYGIAKTDCMTWSMGFKAPSFEDLLFDFVDVFSVQNEHKRYTDTHLVSQESPGEITEKNIRALKQWFIEQIELDDELFARWVGKYLSRDGFSDSLDEDTDISPIISPIAFDTIEIEPNPFIAFNFIRIGHQVYLYVGDAEFKVSDYLAKKLTRKARVKLTLTQKQDRAVVATLLNHEWIYIANEP